MGTLSEQAIQATRAQIEDLFGSQYLPSQQRNYHKKIKGAQEAREAIRPAGEGFQRPDQIRTEQDDDAIRLYELIWKRTLASQMKNATGQRTRILFETEVTQPIQDQSKKEKKTKRNEKKKENDKRTKRK